MAEDLLKGADDERKNLLREFELIRHQDVESRAYEDAEREKQVRDNILKMNMERIRIAKQIGEEIWGDGGKRIGTDILERRRRKWMKSHECETSSTTDEFSILSQTTEHRNLTNPYITSWKKTWKLRSYDIEPIYNLRTTTTRTTPDQPKNKSKWWTQTNTSSPTVTSSNHPIQVHDSTFQYLLRSRMLATYLPIKEQSKIYNKLLLFRTNFILLPIYQIRYRYLCKCQQLDNIIKTEYSKLFHAIAHFRYELYKLHNFREKLLKQKILSRKERKLLIEQTHRQEYVICYYRELIISSCQVISNQSIHHINAFIKLFWSDEEVMKHHNEERENEQVRVPPTTSSENNGTHAEATNGNHVIRSGTLNSNNMSPLPMTSSVPVVPLPLVSTHTVTARQSSPIKSTVSLLHEQRPSLKQKPFDAGFKSSLRPDFKLPSDANKLPSSFSIVNPTNQSTPDNSVLAVNHAVTSTQLTYHPDVVGLPLPPTGTYEDDAVGTISMDSYYGHGSVRYKYHKQYPKRSRIPGFIAYLESDPMKYDFYVFGQLMIRWLNQLRRYKLDKINKWKNENKLENINNLLRLSYLCNNNNDDEMSNNNIPESSECSQTKLDNIFGYKSTVHTGNRDDDINAYDYDPVKYINIESDFFHLYGSSLCRLGIHVVVSNTNIII